MRIDQELVKRNLFESRNKAQNAIKSGNIFVNSKKITQSGYNVSDNDFIEIKGVSLKYVSKGGLKLEKILNEAKLSLKNKIMVDVGASTGGFTDCAIQNGVQKVYTIDVGSNQLHPTLLKNQLVCCYENTDFRNIDINLIKDASIATIDVSFISCLKMIQKFKELPNLNEILLLIKPQFECGKEIADKYKGVILNKEVHFKILNLILDEFFKNGYFCKYLTYSPIKGGKGNIEYIAYFTTSKYDLNQNINTIINEAFLKLHNNKKLNKTNV